MPVRRERHQRNISAFAAPPRQPARAPPPRPAHVGSGRPSRPGLRARH